MTGTNTDSYIHPTHPSLANHCTYRCTHTD